MTKQSTTQAGFHIILSPTKQMNCDSDLPSNIDNYLAKPRFLEQTLCINEALKQFNEKDLATLMKMSTALAESTFERIHSFSQVGAKSHPALFSYSGAVFQSLSANTLSSDDLNYAQKNISILSGLYGILRPFDQIEAYRLEMQTKLKVEDHDNLYQFWSENINETLQNTKRTVLNLASTEYSKIINKKDLPSGMINLHFKESKDGKVRTVGTYAKIARGAMCRGIIQGKVESIEDLKALSPLNYNFSEDLSSEKDFTYIRTNN